MFCDDASVCRPKHLPTENVSLCFVWLYVSSHLHYFADLLTAYLVSMNVCLPHSVSCILTLNSTLQFLNTYKHIIHIVIGCKDELSAKEMVKNVLDLNPQLVQEIDLERENGSPKLYHHLQGIVKKYKSILEMNKTPKKAERLQSFLSTLYK